MHITKAIDWINELGYLIDGITTKKTDRTRSAVGLLSLSLEHQSGIISLIDNRFYGSALALSRPQFEAFIRGIWYQHCASEKQILLFIQNNEPPKIDKLIHDLENSEIYSSMALSSIKKKVWKSMNDYTHGGSIQMKARNSQDEIVHNYKPDHIDILLTISISIGLATAVEILRIANNEERARELSLLYERIFKCEF